MESNYIKIMLGGQGGRLITGTDAVSGSWNVLVVNEDAVFETITVAGTNVVTGRGYTGATITTGMIIGSGYTYEDTGVLNKITSVKLVSGSVMAY